MNWLGIILAAGSTLLVGFLWYNPRVFGNIWMKAAGVDPEAAKNSNMLLVFGITMLVAAVAAFQMSYSIHDDEALAPFLHGMYHGMRVSVFYIAPAIIINALFEGKSISYILVNAGYFLVSFSIMGGILYSIG
jgi:hypothetical protein